MTRPLRLEYPGTIYHITSRGNNRQDIYLDSADFLSFLERMGKVRSRFGWIYYAYCLMGNHYHLVVETPQANLARGMAYLNGGYAQRFNKLHQRVGHLFQARYKALLVQREEYLLTVLRYTVLNPVRAGICKHPVEYPHSSYRETLDQGPKMRLADRDAVMRLFSDDPDEARALYCDFVRAGHKAESIHAQVKSEFFLGDEEFVSSYTINLPDEHLSEVVLTARPDPRPSLKQLIGGDDSVDTVYQAYKEWGYSMRDIGRHLRKHHSTISRLIRGYEEQLADQGN